ncbi:MAG: SpoIID/LytB domain-containing protein [Thermostichus sp. BF3_bins_97]
MLMRRRQFGLAVLGSLWVASGRSVQAQPSLAGGWLAVELFSRLGRDPLTSLELTGPFVLEQQPFPTGTWRLHIHHQQLFLTGPGQPRRYQGSLWLQGGELRSPSGEGRRYRGLVQIRPEAADQIRLINWVELEEYLWGLVPSEMPPDWPAAALQAQAILARTLAVPFLQPRLRADLPEGSRLRDSTADQVYGGLTYETATTTAAVRETQGQILIDPGDAQPIAALFHSTCGGHTSANQDIFAPPARPYLQGVVCEWCQASPFYGPHTVQVTATDLEQALGSSDLAIVQSDLQGRPLRIRVGSRVWDGQTFGLRLGQTLGWGILPSNRFTFERPPEGSQEPYTFTYRGAGHGVGLCQWGSRGLAEQGRTAQHILSHYFPGVQLTQTL